MQRFTIASTLTALVVGGLAGCLNSDDTLIGTTDQHTTWDEDWGTNGCPGFTKVGDDGLFKAVKHTCTYEVTEVTKEEGKPKAVGYDKIDRDMCMSPPQTPPIKRIVGKDTEVTDEVSASVTASWSAKIATEASVSFAEIAGAKVSQEIQAGVVVNGGLKATRKETLKLQEEVSFLPCHHMQYEVHAWEIPITGKAKAKVTYWVLYQHAESGYSFWSNKGTKESEVTLSGRKSIMGSQSSGTGKDLGCAAVHPLCPKKACISVDGDDECHDEPPTGCGDGFCELAEFGTCDQDCMSNPRQRVNDVSYANACARVATSPEQCPDDTGGGGDDGGDDGGGDLPPIDPGPGGGGGEEPPSEPGDTEPPPAPLPGGGAGPVWF